MLLKTKTKVQSKEMQQVNTDMGIEKLKEEVSEIELLLSQPCLKPREEALQREKQHLIGRIKEREKHIELRKIKNLEMVKTMPPQGWFCGMMEELVPEKRWKNEAFNKAIWAKQINFKIYESVFVGYVPPLILKIYHQVAKIIGKENIFVVSPDEALFKRAQHSSDPMLFVYIDGNFYRLATWDIAEDLKNLKERKVNG